MNDTDSAGRAHPHGTDPVAHVGPPLGEARTAMLLLHGRGDSGPGILGLVPELDNADTAYLAPTAAGSSWYPFSFLAPTERNQPWLGAALAVVGRALADIAEAGVPPERTLLLGFSQGACLALEWTGRNPERARDLGGVAALSGGLIGKTVSADDYPGRLTELPVFLGCSSVDPHIPLSRVRESAAILRGMCARVTERIYPEMGHTVNADEIRRMREMLQEMETDARRPRPGHP